MTVIHSLPSSSKVNGWIYVPVANLGYTARKVGWLISSECEKNVETSIVTRFEVLCQLNVGCRISTVLCVFMVYSITSVTVPLHVHYTRVEALLQCS